MTMTTRFLAGGTDWHASEVICRAGPADAPFEEQHDRICMAVVLNGTFGYRSSCGEAILAPGAVLLGNAGDCFECGHRHSVGDRCLSFHFAPSFYDAILADIPGARRFALDRPAAPPQAFGPGLLPNADAVLDDTGAIEEFAFGLAARMAAWVIDASPPRTATTANCGRIQDLVQWIESEADQPLSLATLAGHASMSRYHLLREFRRVTGTTPHQFILSLRTRMAAQCLRNCTDSVLNVALRSGFSDLSEFNRRFRRSFGLTPRAYRARYRGAPSE